MEQYSNTCEYYDFSDMTLVKEDCQYTESHTVIFYASNYKTMHFEKFGEERARDM